MHLNDQQKKINNAHGSNVVVSASAGTGKTTVLTARLIDYIKQKNSVSDYLVVSFTEAAASELKDRISAELKRSMNEASEEMRKHYLSEIAKIPLANISTIHSFCLELIKKYGYVLDIDPAIAGRLADEGILKEIRDEAFRQALNIKEHNELIYRYMDRPEDISDFQSVIEKLDRFITNLDKPEEWLYQQKKLYDEFSHNDLSNYPIDLESIFTRLLNDLEKANKDNYEIYINNIIEKDPKKPSKIKAKAIDLNDNLTVLLEQMRNDLKQKHFEKIAKAAFRIDGYPALGSTKIDEDLKAEAKENKTIFDNALSELQSYYKIEEANRENAGVVKEILKICEDYHAAYERLKEENNVIGFEDMLSKAKQILDHNDGQIAKIYQNKFKEIMVDEYQDTNQYQDSIIRSISRGNNIFRVGDIKQSIYRFQNAKPELMKELISDQVNNNVLKLQYNYRSCKSIIRFSNYLFDKLMNMEEGSYKSNNDDLMIPEESSEKEGRKIRLVTVPYESDEKVVSKDSKGNEKVKALKTFRAKEKSRLIAEYIASEIVRLKNENSQLSWKSFVVLLRGNRQKTIFKRVFTEHNIPIYTTAKTGFFSDPAVSTVIAILELIEKNSRIDALNVLSSPMFSFTYDEIANNKDLLDLDKDTTLSRFIRELRDYHKDHSVPELLNYIYNYNDFYMEKISSYQRSNLDSLYQLVLDYQDDSGSIKDLLTYLSASKKVEKEEASGFTSKDDVVQVMTIHQSKGLQFGYVFVADMFFSSRNSHNSIINVSEKDGIVPKYISMPYKIMHANPYYDLVKENNDYAEFAEELRILYVAVTRAVEGLYVVNAYETKEDKLELDKKIQYNQGMMTWIKAALNGCEADIEELVEIEQLSEEDMKEHHLVASKNESESFVKDKYAKELTILETRNISPSKMEDREIDKLSFYTGSGSERGTLMHKAIELLKIKKVSEEDLDKLPFELNEDDKKRIIRFYKDPFTVIIMNNHNEHEYPFICYQDGQLSNGIIDLLSIGEEIYIIDFKSDKNTSEDKLRVRYTGQLNMYRDVVSKAYPDKKIETLIYSFDLNRYVNI